MKGGFEGEVARVMVKISGLGALGNDTVKIPWLVGELVMRRAGGESEGLFVRTGLGTVIGDVGILAGEVNRPLIAMKKTTRNNIIAIERRKKLSLFFKRFIKFLL